MKFEDIEDIAQNIVGNKDIEDHSFKVKFNPRYRKEDLENNGNNDLSFLNFLPGKYSIYFKTWGCSHNSSDTGYMMGLLAQSGYQIVDSPEQASLWILNSCTVKNPAEDHFRNEINKALSAKKKLVVAGCVSQSDYKASYLRNLSIIGVQQIDKVVEVVEETLKGNVVKFLAIRKNGKKKAGGASLHMPKIRRNQLIEIIAISTGCNNVGCTYCKTKHARGNLGSYPVNDIVQRAQTAFSEGVKEIWITSEDTGAYGLDIGSTLPELLNELIKVIPKDCMLRIGMTNPPYILDHLEEMSKILKHPRVYSFLHIPVQSGSDEVLYDMKREYCLEDFCYVVDYLFENVPGITIATDIICGFPTETKQNFQETLQLIDRYRFPVLFINQFYPRPGTPASKMKRVPTKEVKERSREISKLFNSYQPYSDRIHKQYEILVTEESNDKNYFVGHNKCYEQILVSKNETHLGDWIVVEIIAHGKHHMIGKKIYSRLTINHSIPWKLSLPFKVDNTKTIVKQIWFTSCIAILFSSVLYKIYKKL